MYGVHAACFSCNIQVRLLSHQALRGRGHNSELKYMPLLTNLASLQVTNIPLIAMLQEESYCVQILFGGFPRGNWLTTVAWSECWTRSTFSLIQQGSSYVLKGARFLIFISYQSTALRSGCCATFPCIKMDLGTKNKQQCWVAHWAKSPPESMRFLVQAMVSGSSHG